MALSVCQSLLHNNHFNPVHMATCFAKQYQKEMDRGYGKEIVNIFDAWNNEAVTEDNVFQPSLQQFNGTGSYGNGAAMRVAPVALFSNNYQQCIDVGIFILLLGTYLLFLTYSYCSKGFYLVGIKKCYTVVGL